MIQWVISFLSSPFFPIPEELQENMQVKVEFKDSVSAKIIYAYTHTHTHTHTHIYIYICIYVFTCIHTSTHIFGGEVSDFEQGSQ